VVIQSVARWVLQHPFLFYLLVAIYGALVYMLSTVERDQRDYRGCTALCLAAENGEMVRVRSLLEDGADVDGRDDCRWTPLMRAAGEQRLAVIRLLIERGAQLHVQDTTGGWTALIWAAKEGYLDIIRQLLNAGADINLHDYSGRSAAPWAHREGHVEIAGLLHGGTRRQ